MATVMKPRATATRMTQALVQVTTRKGCVVGQDIGRVLGWLAAGDCVCAWLLSFVEPACWVLTPDAVLPAVCVDSFLFYLLHQDLPEGWVEVPDEASGAVYYYNNNTGESLWERPTA